MRGEFKIYKSGDFTVMPMIHLKDKTLSLKAVGLLSKMLSLPEDWDYSLNGLVAITKDGLDSVRSALNELKDHDYVEILKLRTEKGTFKYNYLVFENPAEKALKVQNKPDMENPYLDEPNVVNQGQYNINNIKDKEDIEDKTKIKHKSLINELIRLDYIREDDEQLPLYDSLFNKMVNEGRSYIDIYSAIHYIVPRVISREFVDEEGKEIRNRFGYLKSSIESNIRKLNSYNEELYSNDDSLWKDFEI